MEILAACFLSIRIDIEVKSEDISNYNLILVGGPNSNTITKEINNHLPIWFEENSIIAGAQKIVGDDVGLAMIYPNSLNKKRYVVIHAGIF